MSSSPPTIMNETAKQRVKFKCVIHKSSDHEIKEKEWGPLAKALLKLEELGAAPLAIDGRVCGNGAVLSSDNSILVSKSGRYSGTKYDDTQFVRVTSFDIETWTANISCDDPTITSEPSSDAPLLWYALKVAPTKFGWEKHPKFILHGHTCKTAEDAKRLQVPCSTKETLFSTPADLDALVNLLEEYPYPKHNIFVRLNHGFFLLADTPDEAIHLFETKLCSTSMKEQVSGDCNRKRKEIGEGEVQGNAKKSKEVD